MRTKVIARVQITVELDLISEQWNDLSTVEQVHREGGQMALERIDKLCQRYVRIIGKPVVQAVSTTKDDHRG